jgi:hypothetical protein
LHVGQTTRRFSSSKNSSTQIHSSRQRQLTNWIFRFFAFDGTDTNSFAGRFSDIIVWFVVYKNFAEISTSKIFGQQMEKSKNSALIEMNQLIFGTDMFNNILSFLDWKFILTNIGQVSKLFHQLITTNNCETWNHIFPHQTICFDGVLSHHTKTFIEFLNRFGVGTRIPLKKLIIMCHCTELFEQWKPQFIQSASFCPKKYLKWNSKTATGDWRSLQSFLSSPFINQLKKFNVHFLFQKIHEMSAIYFWLGDWGKSLSWNLEKFVCGGDVAFLVHFCPSSIKYLKCLSQSRQKYRYISRFKSLERYSTLSRNHEETCEILINNAETLESVTLYSTKLLEEIFLKYPETVFPRLKCIRLNDCLGFADLIDSQFIATWRQQLPSVVQFNVNIDFDAAHLHNAPPGARSIVLVVKCIDGLEKFLKMDSDLKTKIIGCVIALDLGTSVVSDLISHISTTFVQPPVIGLFWRSGLTPVPDCAIKEMLQIEIHWNHYLHWRIHRQIYNCAGHNGTFDGHHVPLYRIK